MSNDGHPFRTALKWTLFVVLFAFVCRHGYRLWNQSEVRDVSLGVGAFGWLLGSGIAYTVGWLPSVWFWRELMRACGGQVTFAGAARAYYCGHLGKYIPGKAMVLVIRSAMVSDRGCPASVAAITALYETLTMMGTGLAVGAATAPLLFTSRLAVHGPDWSVPVETGLCGLAVLALVAASLPLLSRILSWIAVKALPGVRSESGRFRIGARLIGRGSAAFVLSWALQGLSLMMTLRAVGQPWIGPDEWLIATGAMALSTSLGFAVLFAPGGLGVREGILLSILSSQPGITSQAAVAATVLSRIVSFVAELAVSSVLYTRYRAGSRAG